MKNLFNEEITDQTCVDSDFWQTPPDLYADYMTKDDSFDPCPVSPDFNGLEVDWYGNVFCNPPYSQIPEWIDKALKEAKKPATKTIVMLLPNWTDRRWFEKIQDKKIKFYVGRLRFLNPITGRPENSPRFGSMLVTIK